MITPFNATTSPTKISDAKFRAGLIIQNLSDTDIYVAVEGSSDVTAGGGAKPGMLIKANGGTVTADGPHCPQHAIWVIHGGTGSKAGTIQEW